MQETEHAGCTDSMTTKPEKKSKMHSTNVCGTLPNLALEPLQHGIRVLNVLLRLLPHVEDGAIATGAEDILMQRSLAPLALCPQPGEANLQFGRRCNLRREL